jgi:hypothetical protein
MHSLRIFLKTLLFLLAWPVLADHELLVIVTTRSSPVQSMSLDTLKRVYLRKTLLDYKGTPWIPVNLPVSHPVRQGFSLTMFNKRPEDQEDYWNQQYFSGINPPEVLDSEEAILRFVAITPGAIAYIRKGSVDDRVKILKNISISVAH